MAMVFPVTKGFLKAILPCGKAIYSNLSGPAKKDS
jgi:hypothetical protein